MSKTTHISISVLSSIIFPSPKFRDMLYNLSIEMCSLIQVVAENAFDWGGKKSKSFKSKEHILWS